MPTVYRLNYQPDLDKNWSSNPGLCTAMTGLVQLQNGNLGSFSSTSASSFSSTTGTEVLHAQMFTQVAGTVRLLAFRTTNIDEYDNSGTRTNRATALTTATSWAAAAWGNQIIAVSLENATQSSTGAGFSALGGSSPKAKCIASNANFVMMANVDDGGSNVYTDMVWWSGIRNPNTYVPSQATQSGRVRLLDTPGPIKQVVAMGNNFVVFKENAIYVGQYIGPPYVFGWSVIHRSVGLSYARAVTECDGSLYFVHKSGFYRFDGRQVANVGLGVSSVISTYFGNGSPSAVGDEKEGLVWFFGYAVVVGGGTSYRLVGFAYNTRTNLWSALGLATLGLTDGAGQPQAVAKATYAERAAFHSGGASGFSYFDNASSPNYWVTQYPTSSNVTASLSTGYIGSNEGVTTAVRVYPRFVVGSGSTISSANLIGSNDENSSGTDGTHALTWNSEMMTLDGQAGYRFKTIDIAFSTSTNIQLAGVGVELVGSGKR